MKFITLLTDFGLKDGYPGVMKGVIWRIAPDAQIADLTHLIPSQNVLAGSLNLSRSFPYYPDGTVHIAVVDPGVGTERRPIAARLGEHFFVLPDNGLITYPLLLAHQNGWQMEFVHLDQPRYWLENVSNVFHGRDIFSPVGAHLARGVPLRELGSLIDDPIALEPPAPARTDVGWNGEIIDIDHFGNLSTNLREGQVTIENVQDVHCCGETIKGMVRTFGERQVGDLVSFLDSDGRLGIAVVNGNAADRLNAHPGDSVQVTLR